MKNIMIIGCNGFIGNKLAKYILNKNHFVVGMDIDQNSKILNKNFVYYNFDYENNDILKYEIDTIYYMSWVGVSSVDKNNPEKQLQNIILTYKMLEFAHKIGVKKIIIPGSMSEFSKSQNYVDGTEIDSPSDLYAATKVAIRKIAYQFCNKNRICLNWLLITSVYSVDRTDANLITYAIKSLIDNKVVECTKLEQKWDYICDNDLVKAMYLIGMYGKDNEIYPVGSGEINELSFYIEYIAKYLDKEHLLNIGAIPYKNDYIDNSMPNISKLQKLGFEADYKFSTEIIKIIENIIQLTR